MFAQYSHKYTFRQSIKVSDKKKKNDFGLRNGNKEPKHGLRDISMTIQVLKMDSAPLNYVCGTEHFTILF